MLWWEELRTKLFGPRTIIVQKIILQAEDGGRSTIEAHPKDPNQEKGDIVLRPSDGPEFRISTVGKGFFVDGKEVDFLQTGRTYQQLKEASRGA